MKKAIILLVLFYIAACVQQKSSLAGSKNEPFVFTDSRDNKKYKTIKIGSQTWMAENLNYDLEGSKCYDNNSANCDKYGRLYNWNEAMEACPEGWRLPSNADWDVLYRFVDGSSGTESPYKSPTAGKLLKAKSGWDNYEGRSGNGMDAFGFMALPGGGKDDGSFNTIGSSGFWWSSSSENLSGDAYSRVMTNGIEYAIWLKGGNSFLFSVRCVGD